MNDNNKEKHVWNRKEFCASSLTKVDWKVVWSTNDVNWSWLSGSKFGAPASGYDSWNNPTHCYNFPKCIYLSSNLDPKTFAARRLSRSMKSTHSMRQMVTQKANNSHVKLCKCGHVYGVQQNDFITSDVLMFVNKKLTGQWSMARDRKRKTNCRRLIA